MPVIIAAIATTRQAHRELALLNLVQLRSRTKFEALVLCVLVVFSGMVVISLQKIIALVFLRSTTTHCVHLFTFALFIFTEAMVYFEVRVNGMTPIRRKQVKPASPACFRLNGRHACGTSKLSSQLKQRIYSVMLHHGNPRTGPTDTLPRKLLLFCYAFKRTDTAKAPRRVPK